MVKSISKEQAKILLRAAVQYSKVTGLTPEESLLALVKSVAQTINIRNKG